MKTISIDDPGLVAALEAALATGVVAIPTDTVYGLAVRPGSEALLAEAKGRPEAMPVALLGTTAQLLGSALAAWSPLARRLADRCWPGPLTIVLPSSAGEGTVGLRAPGLPELEQLFERTGPLAVTSANLHGRPPATTAAGVAEAMGEQAERVALVVNGGTCDGAVSTVVAVRGSELEVLREGAIGTDALEALRT